MRVHELLEAFGAPDPKLPKNTKPAQLLQLLQDAVGVGDKASYPIASYTAPAIKLPASVLRQTLDFLEDQGDARIGHTPRGKTSPQNPSYTQHVYHMGHGLYVAVASGDKDIYVCAYRA